MILLYIGLAISVILFFLKQWIHYGVQIASKRTKRYAIVIAIIAVTLYLATAK